MRLRIFSLLVVVLCCGRAYASVSLDRVVAIVNNEVITWSELYRVMEFELSQQMRFLGDEEKRKLFKEKEMFFLKTIIDMKLQLQEAKKRGIFASDEEIDATINNIKAKYSMDEASFDESLKKEGFSMGEYRKRLSEQILIGKLVSQEVTSKVTVEDSEVEAYIKETGLRPEDLLGYRIFQIFFKKPDKEQERKSVEKRAAEAMKRLDAGEDFSLIAMEFSEDPIGKKGGDLGYVKKSSLARDFIEVLSAMKPGGISSPFWTEKGLHIIKLQDIAGPSNTNEAKETLRETLMDKAFSKQYKTWMRGLREKSYIEIKL